MKLLTSQSCPTLCNPMDCSLPGFSVHGISQARILEGVAISFSRWSSQPRDQAQFSCIAGHGKYNIQMVDTIYSDGKYNTHTHTHNWICTYKPKKCFMKQHSWQSLLSFYLSLLRYWWKPIDFPILNSSWPKIWKIPVWPIFSTR